MTITVQVSDASGESRHEFGGAEQGDPSRGVNSPVQSRPGYPGYGRRGRGLEPPGLYRGTWRAKVPACQVTSEELIEEVERAYQAHRQRVPGLGKGMISIVSDDDDHLKDFAEYMP